VPSAAEPTAAGESLAKGPRGSRGFLGLTPPWGRPILPPPKTSQEPPRRIRRHAISRKFLPSNLLWFSRPCAGDWRRARTHAERGPSHGVLEEEATPHGYEWSSEFGIDIDTNVIRHVSNKYIRHNRQFKAGSITDIPIPGDKIFQVRVCFEGIEHIDDHEELLNEVKRVLAPDGALIVSTPNKSAYSDEPQYKNPFHVSELYYDEF
jgi:SAM-dependent methyltransferase